MKKYSRIIILITINIFLIAGLLEILLRVTAPILPGSAGIAARWIATGKPYASEWTPAWQQNRDHYWALRPGLDNVLQYGSPSVSFSLSTIELWEGGGIGFRTDPIDFFVHAVVVGDSFGMCFTERPDCWVELLGDSTGLNIVNLSQPVTGTTSHGRILQDFGQPLQPPLVIWQFFGNDFNDDYGLAVFRGDIDAIPEESESLEEDAGVIDWLQRHSVLAAILETLYTGRFTGVPDSEQVFVKPYQVKYGADDELTLQFGGAYELQALDMSREQNVLGYDMSRTAFAEAQALVDDWDGELVIVIVPTREEVYAHLTAPIMGEDQIARLRSARDAMHKLCDELALRCFDPLSVFEERARNDEALYYVDDMHLNIHGNAVLAAALAAYLEDEALLPDS